MAGATELAALGVAGLAVDDAVARRAAGLGGVSSDAAAACSSDAACVFYDAAVFCVF